MFYLKKWTKVSIVGVYRSEGVDEISKGKVIYCWGRGVNELSSSIFSKHYEKKEVM